MTVDALSDSRSAYQKAVRTFCDSRAFKKLKCGFASLAEQEATTEKAGLCPYCGTLFTGEPHPPMAIIGHFSYYQLAKRIISLACKGRVVIRAVFKSDDGSCIKLDPYREGGDVRRCELRLPRGYRSETLAAVHSKEENCTLCKTCNNALPCPRKAGKWYSGACVYTSRALSSKARYMYLTPPTHVPSHGSSHSLARARRHHLRAHPGPVFAPLAPGIVRVVRCRHRRGRQGIPRQIRGAKREVRGGRETRRIHVGLSI